MVLNETCIEKGTLLLPWVSLIEHMFLMQLVYGNEAVIASKVIKMFGLLDASEHGWIAHIWWFWSNMWDDNNGNTSALLNIKLASMSMKGHTIL